MQPGETAVGIRLRVNLNRNSCSSQLGRHFVEISNSKIHHPGLVGIPEIVTRLRERAENKDENLLLPNGFLVDRWCDRDSQVLLVPTPQRCRIVSSEEQSSDSRHFLHFRFSGEPRPNGCPPRGRRDLRVYGCLRRYAELVPAHDEARPESK